MKLLFRHKKSTRFALDVDNSTTFAVLSNKVKTFMAEKLDEKLCEIYLSLDGKHLIESTPDTLITEYFVGGDIVYVLDKIEKSESVPADVLPKTFLDAKIGQIPQQLQQLYDKVQPTSSTALLNIIVHLNMLENGFIYEGGDIQWDSMILQVMYNIFATCSLTVTMVTMGAEKHLFGLYEKQTRAIEWRFKTEDYIKGNSLDTITDLPKLVIELRNNIILPIQSTLHEENIGMPLKQTLLGLPIEIIHHIAEKLDIKSMLKLSETCKTLHRDLTDNVLWKKIYTRKFGERHHSEDNVNWKCAYQITYQEEKLKRLTDNTRSPHYEDIPCIPPFPDGPPVPRINPNLPVPNYPVHPFGVPNPYPINPFQDPDSPYYMPRDDPRGFFAPRYPSRRGPRFDYL